MRFWTGSSNKRRKHFAAVFLVIAFSFACLFMGCGSKAVSLDADGNAPITSNWRLVSYTVNGNTTVVKDLHWFIKVFLSSKTASESEYREYIHLLKDLHFMNMLL